MTVYAIGATSLIGGGEGALDAVYVESNGVAPWSGAGETPGVHNGDPAFVTVQGDKIYHYIADSTSGAAESSPSVIKPDWASLGVAYTGDLRWILHDVYKAHTQGTDTALGTVSAKNPPIDADLALYRDSTAANAIVTSTWTQVKAFLKTYFDTLYNKYVLENHASKHTDGTDDIQSATAAQKGVATSAQITKLDGIEALADVTDTDNVTAAGALMDSEIDADLKTLSLPANTTISSYAASLVDDETAAAARATLELNLTTAGKTSGAHKIGIASIGTPTFTTVGNVLSLINSAGRATGGAISDAGGETVNVAAGTGFIKAADDDTAELLSFDWAASNGLAVPTDTMRYIGVVFGDPPVVDIRTAGTHNLDSEFPLGTVVNEGGTLHIHNNPWWVTDGITNIIERFQAQGHLTRDAHVGGLVLSVTATRRIVVSPGTLWSRLNEYSISAFTSVADAATFEAYYVDAIGVWRDADLTQYLVTSWNDTSITGTGALATLDNNKYINLWIYVEADDSEIALVYGQAQHVSAASAEAEAPPTNIPVHISEHGILIGRILIKKGVDTPVEVQSVWETTFTASQASDHGNLTGLTDNDHQQYSLIGTQGVFAGSGTFAGLTGDVIDIGATLGGTSYAVTVTAQADSEDVGAIYITTKTTSQFTVFCTGSGTPGFDWILVDLN